MSDVGQRERVTQNRVVQLFCKDLGYRYLGNWHSREGNRNIDNELLTPWLKQRGVGEVQLNRVFRELESAAALGEGKQLYDVNRAVYQLLRYGVKVSEGAGEKKQTVWLIDWKNPEANDFALAEEVSIQGELKKRPDLVLYVNGIALAVIELKRSSVSVSEGIRQNLDNQSQGFIRSFFSTIQLVMAGNDSQGLRYGVINTPEKFYLEWQEEADSLFDYKLDHDLQCLCNKRRFLQIIHDLMVFDAGIKKTCRHNQYFGIEAAKRFIDRREGGIIWHTQGSGKSLTMVWLAKWIRENVTDSRVLLVTDRTELDDQIKSVFEGVGEDIYRTRSGADLVAQLNRNEHWLICSLVHKFGRYTDDDDDDRLSEQATQAFIAELNASLPAGFAPKGRLFVFVDECHRTQSGKLHKAMTAILPEALFIGFTGTPLMKKDKKKSLEVFGQYIHTYKFDKAVKDGVVLDLRYEARDIDQYISSPKKIDAWFESKTAGLSNIARSQLKQRWGSMQTLLSSRSRLAQIVDDILMDMETRPRLKSGRGNAMLVCSSVYQACTVYEMFSKTELKDKCAIITSYQPTASSIKGETTGAGDTEKLRKYQIYRRMLADFFGQTEDEASGRVAEFEQLVKEKFIKQPGQMKLLIVVDKLLTGFDAPSASYLYIDKQMADHNLFQAICRVNRLDDDGKEYGYIVDYKDLFKSLEKSIKDYTAEAFDGYDQDDVAGLLKNRLEQGREDLENALEMVRALCEPVPAPRDLKDYQHYFCGVSGENQDDLPEKEALRLSLYQFVAKLLRAWASLANEMKEAGFSASETEAIRAEVVHYEKMRDGIKLASGDALDMKRFEPDMRYLLDQYVRAEDSETLMDFEELGLLELIVERGITTGTQGLPADIRKDPEAMAETIENNVRKTIVDENPVNPRYYEKMSALLEELVQQRRQNAIAYQEYLEQIQALSRQVLHPNTARKAYPGTIQSSAQQALYDNFGEDEVLVSKIDLAIRFTKKADWKGSRMKEKEIARAIKQETAGYDIDIDKVIELARNQRDYD